MAAQDAQKRALDARKIILSSEIMLLSGEGLPWDEYYNVPIGGRYFRRNGEDFKKISSTDNSQSGWAKVIIPTLPSDSPPGSGLGDLGLGGKIAYANETLEATSRGEGVETYLSLDNVFLQAGDYLITADFAWGNSKTSSAVVVELWQSLSSEQGASGSRIALNSQEPKDRNNICNTTMKAVVRVDNPETFDFKLKYSNSSPSGSSTLYSGLITVEAI